MTVKEFIQGMILIFCMMATGIVLPVGLIVGSASHDDKATLSSTGPVFIFEEAQ